MKNASQMDRMRAVFQFGERLTSARAIEISGMTGVQGRKTINRLVESGELLSNRSVWPPVYERVESMVVVVQVDLPSVPNVGNVAHALATAPRSIFDIGRL